LKKHPFFKGIDWKNLRKTRAPKLVLEANVFFVIYISIQFLLNSCLHPSENVPIQANYDDSQDSNWLSHTGSVCVNQHSIHNGAASSSEVRSHISKLSSIDSFDSKW
jgi:3-phosphoinositide dependent protein kinase-1